ncbi:MAG: sensor histidine kinase, partial [Microcoleaceae cyanobacterium]
DGALLILHTRLKEKSDTRGIEIIKEYGKLPEVTCYASQLNQVFMNIMTNAIDALEVNRNKEITVQREPAITIKSEVLDSKWVRISISDSGSGMEPDILAKIFDPFFSTKPIGSGTGLGLSISYSIVVEKHGGKINCISEVGKGTEFTIDVPVQQAGAS